jgi:lipid A 3-O-deacylase
MTIKWILLLLISLGLSFETGLLAQVKYETEVKKPAPKYVRLDVENDMLIPRDKTDRYFSSGLRLDYCITQVPDSKKGIQKAFLKLKDAELYIGLLIMSNMYTPTNLTEIVAPGDRPYAGWLCAGMKGISNSYAQSTRFTTEYSLGVIGPAAMQETFQKQLHRVIGRPQPKGWKNQIANDIAFNINFIGEKRLVKPAENVDFIGILETNIGTVTTYMGIGSMIRVGWFDDYFKNIMQLNGTNPWQVFVFARPTVRIVADNSLLQGGVFTYHKSPYVILKDDLNRVYMETEFGYGLSYKCFNFTYSQNIRTAEFKGAKNMFWGKMSLAYCF